MLTDSGRCGSCGAAVVWTTTGKGKSMPVDAEPVVGGNIRLTQRTYPLGPLATVCGPLPLELEADDDGIRYLSHFVTCPHSAQHRRPRVRSSKPWD